MKNFLYSISLTAFLLLSGINTSFGEGFKSIHSSDGINVVAAGDFGNIFRSANGGTSWSKYSFGSVNFRSVYTFGTNVWLSTSDGKVYKANTTSFILTPYNTGVTTSINSIYFIDADNGFVCGDNGVVYKSVNGGLTWTPSNTGIAAGKMNSIYFENLQNGIVVGDNGKAYVTVNGGTSWTPETIATTRNLLDAKIFAAGMAAAGEWGTLFVKPNSGSWSAVETRINTDIRSITGSSYNDIHVCGGGGFIRNNKNNSSNFYNFEKNPMLADLVDIVYTDNNTGYAASSMNDAIIKTVDGGTSWQLTAGATVTYNWAAKPGASGNFLGNNLSLHPTDRDAVFIAFGDQVYRSGNKGDVWNSVGNSVPSGNTPHSFFVSPLDTNLWMMAMASGSGGDKIYRTSNYGQSWAEVGPGLNFSNYGQPLEMDQNNPHTFYFAPDNGGFYKSTNDGLTFTEISNDYPFRSPCDILVMWDNSDVLFLADGITGSGQANLFKSTNAGINWTLVHTASASEIPSMCNTVFDKSLVWCTEWSGNNVYKSTDFGDTWATHHSNSFSGWGSDICHEDPTVMVTGSWSSRATLSINSGDTWTDISAGLQGHGGGILVADRGYILAHQGSNIYKLDVVYNVIATAVSENTTSSIPKDFNLSQNYPNPFNPSTKIVYDIPKSGNVSLKVYNQLGKEVSTLVNSFRNAGSYEITFDGASLATGIYFYRLEANGLTDTKKMILVK